ncbi:hypothetical protein [Pendulispora albinea]|uniref:Tetratricopeptide repeat protein n=1 Tax=Pendulispora albinea TaxID=2741071 RepID=A0ABZ2LIX1_9BACT
MQDPTTLLATVQHIEGALAHWYRGRAADLLEDVAGARKSFQECAATAPRGGIDCLLWLAGIESNEGACEDAALAAKQLIAIDSSAPQGYHWLARAEFGRSQQTSAVRAILEERWARLPEPQREAEHRRDEFDLAVLDGRFEQAYESLDAWDHAIAHSADAHERAMPFTCRIDLDLELGRTEAARRAATSFVEASQAWLPEETWDMPAERTRALYLTDQIGRSAFRQRRAQDELELRARNGWWAAPNVRWFDSYVQNVKDAEDARVAVAAQPATRPFLEAAFRNRYVDSELGRMYLYAGQLDKSLELLRRATKSCSYVRGLYVFRAHALYGDALARRARPREACEHYAYVLQRWGHEPGSRTARDATESALRLGCRGSTDTALRLRR